MTQFLNFPESRNSIFDNQFEIISTIGRGSTSVVYRAQRLNHDWQPDGLGELALKVFSGNPKQLEANIERLKREGLAMLACRHPNVIRLYDYVVCGDLCYLVLEFAEYGDLGTALAGREGPVRVESAFYLIGQILSGLSAIHRAGIIHCDIKPENLLLTSPNTIKIGDFSVAILPAQNLSAEEIMRGIGTLDYLAPECLNGEGYSALSDLYSVGLTLYQLLTRQLPFHGETMTEQIENKMAGNILPLETFIEDVPVGLNELFAKALAKRPEDRFQSADEFNSAIESFLSGTWMTATAEVVAPVEEPIEATVESIQEAASIEELPEAPVQEVQTILAGASDFVIDYQSRNQEVLADEPQETEIFFSRDEVPPVEIESIKTEADRASNKLTRLVERVRRGRVRSVREEAFTAGRVRENLFNQAGQFFMLIALGLSVTIFGTFDLIAFAMQSPQQKVSPIVSIDRGTNAGLLFDFWGERIDVPIVSSQLPDGKLLIALGIPGSTPQIIDPTNHDQSRAIYFSANGLRIRLSMNPVGRSPGTILGGSYIEQNSNLGGRWAIFQR